MLAHLGEDRIIQKLFRREELGRKLVRALGREADAATASNVVVLNAASASS